MKANFTNLQNNGKMLNYNARHLRHNNAGVHAYNEESNNETRPAQAISFRGSALSMGQKFIDNTPVNKLVGFVSENEAAYNAIYSLVIAGMLKPMVVLAQTGHDDKDGQMIATKNFLQAFLGSFLGLTVGGGFVKKIWDNIKDNLTLFQIDDNRNLSTLDANSDKAKGIAKKLLIKENTGFGAKFAQAKTMVENADGLKKVPAFFKGMTSNIDYKPTKEQIASRAKTFVENFNQNHKEILEKNPEYLKDLVENMKKLELNPSSAKRELKHGSQLFDAFETFWKRSTDSATSIFKAKIASFLLPSVMAFMFAKRNLENQRAKEAQASQHGSDVLMNNSKSIKEAQNNRFAAVSGGAKADNTVAFKGSILDKAIDISTRGIEQAAMSKPGEKIVHGLAKVSKKPSARMSDLESIGITAYWVGSTAMSKRIDPDQKWGLNVHSVLVTAISSTAAFILDAITDGVINKSESAYLDRLKETVTTAQQKLKEGADAEAIKKLVKKNTSNLFNSEKVLKTLANKETLELNEKELTRELENLACGYSKKLSKFKSLTIFTLVVRFLVPVLTVKMSKRIKNKIIDWTKQRRLEKEAQAKEAQEAQKTQETK